MTDAEQYWVHRGPSSTPQSVEVDRLIGLYESTKTPQRGASSLSSPLWPSPSSEVERLLRLAEKSLR